MLDVNEVFGPTVQGEGPYMGRRCVFVRLSRCDLSCDWCDTPYTWDWDRYNPKKEIHRRSTKDVADQVDKLDAETDDAGVVVSGGEPLLQRSRLVKLVDELQSRGRWVQLETNGRHAPPDGLHPLTRIVASPKLANSGMDYDQRIVPKALDALREWPASFKFVVTGEPDLDEVDNLVAEFELEDVWIMPEGTTAGKVAAIDAIAEQVIERGYNLSTRLHVTLWGSRRGV